MRAPRGDSEQTKAEILKAARRLFAANGILAVSVRDVAKEAGFTHGLVHHYFGTKEQLAEEVIRREIMATSDLLAASPITGPTDPLEGVRRVIRYFFTDGRDSVLLMARAELNGLEPEKLRPEGVSSPLKLMAGQFAQLQAGAGCKGPVPDPDMVSVFLGAAIVGLVLVHPWLMDSAGLSREGYEHRLDEIVEMGVAFVGQMVGIRPGEG